MDEDKFFWRLRDAELSASNETHQEAEVVPSRRLARSPGALASVEMGVVSPARQDWTRWRLETGANGESWFESRD